jgi:hypothetical protein
VRVEDQVEVEDKVKCSRENKTGSRLRGFASAQSTIDFESRHTWI